MNINFCPVEKYSVKSRERSRFEHKPRARIGNRIKHGLVHYFAVTANFSARDEVMARYKASIALHLRAGRGRGLLNLHENATRHCFPGNKEEKRKKGKGKIEEPSKTTFSFQSQLLFRKSLCSIVTKLSISINRMLSNRYTFELTLILP